MKFLKKNKKKSHQPKPVNGAVIGGSKKNSKKYLAMVVMAVCLSLLLWLFFVVSSNNNDIQQKATYACSSNDKLLNEAREALNTGDYAQLLTLVNSIEMTDDYQEDISCLFIIMRHSIVVEDIEALRLHLAQYEVLLDEGYTLSESFQDMGFTRQTFSDELVRLEKTKELRSNNVILHEGIVE